MKPAAIFLGCIASSVLLVACFKGDKPVVLPAPGDAKEYSVSMGSDYATEIYFHLSDGSSVSTAFDQWDLCMEASITGYHIWMNGGNNEYIANTHQTDFSATPDTTSLTFNYDAPDFNADSTAIGEYLVSGASTPSKKEVYIMKRGYQSDLSLRFKKFVIVSANDANYLIRYANLDGSFEDSLLVTKNPQYAFAYFTFDNGGQQLHFEPPVNSWDILFTRYRYVFTTLIPPLPYEVNGVLLNPGTAVARDTTKNFNDIDLAFAQTLTYSQRRDAIGYNWKFFDFASQTYLTKTYYNYIIKDLAGVYWKMHFIDFYNGQGQKGYPKFELKRL